MVILYGLLSGSIALILASRRNPRVKQVLAINPYDYAQGHGIARSSWVGWLIMATARLPIIGDTVMRLRNFRIVSSIFDGGVANPATIPLALLKEMYAVGNRRGHYRAFLSLLHNASSWEAATSDYPRIDIPVILMWGEKDWANSAERAHDYDLIPGADVVTIEHSGHFLAWARPDAILSHLLKMHSLAAVSSRRDNSAG